MEYGNPQQPQQASVAEAPRTGQPHPAAGPARTGITRPLVVGVIAGLAIVVVVWVIIFALGLIPTHFTRYVVSVHGTDVTETPSLEHRLVKSLLVGWGGDSGWRDTSDKGGAIRNFGLAFVPSLLAALAILGAGYLARRRVSGNLRSRLVVWAAAALTATVTVTIAAAAFAHNVTYAADGPGAYSTTHRFTYDPLSFFVATLAWVAVFGAFSFGVVARLPGHAAEALRGALGIVLVPMVVAALAWPFFVAASPIAEGQQAVRIDTVVANSSPNMAGVASMTVPLALGAKAQTDAPNILLFVEARGTEGIADRWPDLETTMSEHPKARLWTWAGAFGAVGKTLAVVAIGLYWAAWIALVTVYTRRQRAGDARQGALCGLWIGGAAAGLSVLFSWLATLGQECTLFENEVSVSAWTSVWAGPTLASYLQMALSFLVSGVVIGLLVAVMKPAEAPAVAAGEAFLAAGGAPSAPPASCPACGTAYAGAETAFCATCGAPRAPADGSS